VAPAADQLLVSCNRWVVVTLLLIGGCATRPINAPIAEFSPNQGYQILARQHDFKDPENLVVLAFSGGGTRAAAFSYGVLETLRTTEIIGPKGKTRLIDEVTAITGVSGGSFTALAYGLYGDKLFDTYDKQFLKRNVQGELISRFLNPVNWPALQSPAWGRSELAAQLYDEILFHGTTFAELDRRHGPLIAVSATDLTTGARLIFDQGFFDVICSDLDTVPLSRAAAASSAVPVLLSPVTINNYGGTCNYQLPSWVQLFTNPATTPRPAARASERLKELAAYNDSVHRPYLHLVDGGVADNVALRGVLDIVEGFEALRLLGKPTPLDHVRRIIIFVVNSHSSPKTTWDENEDSPGNIRVLIKATGVPIEKYSFEAMELLRDTVARWNTFRRIRDSVAFSANKDPALKEVVNAPDVDLYAIDVSFPALEDKAEFDYLNDLPTSFVLPDAAVDRLRTAARTIILESPDFQRLLRDVGATIVDQEPAAARPKDGGPKRDLSVSGSSREADYGYR
jgi:NTE family protein